MIVADQRRRGASRRTGGCAAAALLCPSNLGMVCSDSGTVCILLIDLLLIFLVTFRGLNII